MYKISVCIKNIISIDVGHDSDIQTNLVVGNKYLVKNLSVAKVSISKVRDLDGNYIGHFYSDQFCPIDE